MQETKDGLSSVTKRIPAYFFMMAILTSLFFALGGCATQKHSIASSSDSDDIREQKVSAAFLEGKPEVARELLSSALRTDPRNGYLHLLNGLSYQLDNGSQQSLELAQVGYDAAVKFAPGYFWSHYFAGLAQVERRDYPAAAEQFSWAIMDNPDRPLAFVGLAVSAYYVGDLGVARIAAERALSLAPEDPLMLRTAAYVAAAGGDREYLNAILVKAKGVPAAARDMENYKTRVSQLLRTAAIDQVQGGSEKQPLQGQVPMGQVPMGQVPMGQVPMGQVPMGQVPMGQVPMGQVPMGQVPMGQVPMGQVPVTSGNPKQVMVEVTLLLSQDTTTRRVGINLLDGLTLQFGLDHVTESKYTTGIIDTFSRVFTAALHVPQITYSLNLFNTKDDFYDVIVRPSLVASLGQQSDFFIGQTLTVGVSGINLGSLQPIDVGTSVKVMPIEITNERAKFRIDTLRSFFVPDTSGTFSQSVTFFKQSVGATVEVDFGKTLILSGLYEAVNVGGSSRVPGLGDIPVVDLLFNARTKTQRRNAAIVLVTPRLPGAIETGTREFRTETLTRLLSLWKDLVDPLVNIDAVADKIGGKVSKYFQPQVGDLRLPSATDRETVRLVVNETMGRLH